MKRRGWPTLTAEEGHLAEMEAILGDFRGIWCLLEEQLTFAGNFLVTFIYIFGTHSYKM
jgi:hypothetical protein